MRISGPLILMTLFSLFLLRPLTAESAKSICSDFGDEGPSLSPSEECHVFESGFPLATGGNQNSANTRISLDYSQEFTQGSQSHSWESFLDFVSGRREETAKMNDPYYRHRYPEVSSNWKWFFYQKTPYYYRKGIEFLRFGDGRVRVSLIQQKTNYAELIKGLWTEKAYDMVLESNEGWLGNRTIFGDGRSYYFELSLHFD